MANKLALSLAKAFYDYAAVENSEHVAKAFFKALKKAPLNPKGGLFVVSGF